MTAFSLVPRDKQFFKEFLTLAEDVRSGAQALKQMIASDPPDLSKVEVIKEIEHACDRTTRSIIDRLNRTFVTPLDREDIHALARSLDDVMDAIDAAASLVRLYKLPSVRFGARELAKVISLSTASVRLAVDALDESQSVSPHSIEINRLENEADRIHQEGVMKLFDEERDPILVMKWKETLDRLEEATDRCEDVANVLEGVMVKHG